jgi:hypothetical protein
MKMLLRVRPRRVAVLSVPHPWSSNGDAGGMNVYVVETGGATARASKGRVREPAPMLDVQRPAAGRRAAPRDRSRHLTAGPFEGGQEGPAVQLCRADERRPARARHGARLVT